MSGQVDVVGRTRELDVVGRLLDADPDVRRVVVSGPAGIGKTTLVTHCVASARSDGQSVAHLRPTEGEHELPGSALADLIVGVSPEALERITPLQRSALEATSSGQAVAGGPHLLARATLEVLRRAGEHDRLLVVIDDAQWLDRPSATVLSFVLRRLGELRALVAVRTTSEADALPLGAGDWAPRPAIIAVGPLGATDLGEVIRQALGTAPARPDLEALELACGGNPLLAVELERSRRGGASASLPPSISTAFTGRIESLAEGPRAAVSMAAVALQPTIELLLAAGITLESLAEARSAGMLRVQDDTIGFTHPLLATTAYDTLDHATRRALHRQLASLAVDPIERGHHVARGGATDVSDAVLLDEAARSASARADHGGAAAFHLAAARSGAPEDAATRELAAAEALTVAGDVAQALVLGRHLVARLPSGPGRARARCIVVQAAVGGELSYEQSLRELELALADCPDHPAQAAEIYLHLAEIASGSLRLADAERSLRAATELAASEALDHVEVASRAELGFTECMLGRPGAQHAREAFAAWDGSVLSPTAYTPRMILGCVSLHELELARAEELFRDEIAMAQEHGLEAIEVMARAHLAETLVRAGHWAEALRCAEEATAHARQAANEQIAVGASFARALVGALLGHLDSARTIATESLRRAEETGDAWFTISHRSVLGLIALTTGDARAAVEVLSPAWRTMLECGFGNLSIFPVANVLGEACAEAGDLAGALEVVRTLRSCPVGDEPWCAGVAARTEALVASGEARHEESIALAQAAVEAHAGLPEPFERARTRHVQGVVERRARRWGAAREALTDALEQLDELGAARWAERVATDLVRLPGRRRRDQPGLTETERQIADLVAQGLSNKEVASRLFVAVRTVEANLTKVYAKLGVRSRTELAGRLQG